MANTILNNGLYYFQSTDVKVFPCAYRGYQKSTSLPAGTNKIFDPESRAFTEYNYSNLYSKVSKNKESFIISWDTTEGNELLKCVIGGYYFEIKGISPSDTELSGNKVLAIKTKGINYGTIPQYTTYVLDSIYNNAVDYLDVQISQGSTGTGTYYFTGLVIAPADWSNGTAKLPLVKNGEINWSAKRLDDVLDTDIGICSIKMTGDAEAAGTSSNACTATGKFATALGKGTRATGQGATALGTNTVAEHTNTLATGENTKSSHQNSATFGLGTETSASSQVVIGQYNEPTQDTLFIIGNGGTASNRKNAFVVDSYGNTSITGEAYINGGKLLLDNDTTFNTQNVINIGNNEEGIKHSGTLAIYGTGPDKVFEVLNTGDTTIENTLTTNNYVDIKNKTYNAERAVDIRPGLTVQGQIKAEKGLNNTLTLGSTTNSDYGAIDIYGTGETKVFTISNTGATEIKDTLTVTNATTLNNTLDVDGKAHLKNTTNLNEDGTDAGLIVDGGTLIKKKVKINETLLVMQATNLQQGLTVVGNTSTTDKLAANSLEINGTAFTVSNAGACTAVGIVSITDSTESTDATSGALKVSGGVGIAKNINIGGDATIHGISVKKDSFAKIDWDGTNTKANNNALFIDNGVHANGILSCAGDFFVADDTALNAKITNAGSAWFKQQLLVGSQQKGRGVAGDDIFFRVGKAADEKGFLDLKGDLKVLDGGSIVVDGDFTANGNMVLGRANGNTSLVVNGNINASNGTITASIFDAVSDIRRKTNIKDFICEKSILDLPIKEFEYISDEKHIKHIGCIAQDLQQICPELVHEDKDGYLTIEETKLVYLLLKEVKELKEELKELKGE